MNEEYFKWVICCGNYIKWEKRPRLSDLTPWGFVELNGKRTHLLRSLMLDVLLFREELSLGVSIKHHSINSVPAGNSKRGRCGVLSLKN